MLSIDSLAQNDLRHGSMFNPRQCVKLNYEFIKHLNILEIYKLRMAEESVPSEKEIIRDFLEYFLGDDGPFSDVVWDKICIHQARAMRELVVAHLIGDDERSRWHVMDIIMSIVISSRVPHC